MFRICCGGMAAQGLGLSGWLGGQRCAGAAVSMLPVLIACASPAASAPPAAPQLAVVDTKRMPEPLDAARATPELTAAPPMNAAQQVVHRLFGATIGPVFEIDDERPRAPQGYTTESWGSADFDANGLSDQVLVFRRDPEASNPRPPECALILTLATDETHLEVYGVNPHELGCIVDREDSVGPTTTSDSSIVITQGYGNHVMGHASYEISFDTKERRFLLSELSHLTVDPATHTGTFEVFRPLEGRGRIEGYPKPDTEQPEPMEFDVQRIYFEDVGSDTVGHFMRLSTWTPKPAK